MGLGMHRHRPKAKEVYHLSHSRPLDETLAAGPGRLATTGVGGGTCSSPDPAGTVSDRHTQPSSHTRQGTEWESNTPADEIETVQTAPGYFGALPTSHGYNIDLYIGSNTSKVSPRP